MKRLSNNFVTESKDSRLGKQVMQRTYDLLASELGSKFSQRGRDHYVRKDGTSIQISFTPFGGMMNRFASRIAPGGGGPTARLVVKIDYNSDLLGYGDSGDEVSVIWKVYDDFASNIRAGSTTDNGRGLGPDKVQQSHDQNNIGRAAQSFLDIVKQYITR